MMYGPRVLVAFARESLGLEGTMWGMKNQSREAVLLTREIHSR